MHFSSELTEEAWSRDRNQEKKSFAIPMAARKYRTPECVLAALRELDEDQSGSESETSVQGEQKLSSASDTSDDSRVNIIN